MSTVVIKNADVIVTMDQQGTVLYNKDIVIEDGRITAFDLPDHIKNKDGLELIDGRGHIVYPGLINTHHHLYQTFTRNLPDVQNMELFPWLKTLYQIWRRLNPEIIYFSSLVGMAELLKYGCTTCFDHHYVFPRNNNQDLIEKQIEAAQTLGIRLHASRGSMSRGETDGGLPPDDLVQTTDEILRDSQRLIEAYHDPAPLSMCQIVLAPCSPFSVTSDLLKESAALARCKGVRMHTHLAETRDEEAYCLEVYGKRPLDYIADLGWLGEDVWFAHGIYFSEEELTLMGQTKTGVAHCPVSNMKLSSGIAKVPEMLVKGVPVGLAVDGSASNDCSNLLAEIRAAYLLHRLNSSAQAPTAGQILGLATQGSAELLGRKDIGSLEIGKAGDLFMMSTNLPECVGALSDPVGLPAAVGLSRPAALTMVNGRVVVREGRIVNLDENNLFSQAQRCWENFITC